MNSKTLIVFLTLVLGMGSTVFSQEESLLLDYKVLNVKVLDVLPVGWGYLYALEIDGDVVEFPDTLRMGCIIGQFPSLEALTYYQIKLQPTGEFNDKEYLPAFTGCEDENKLLWKLTSVLECNSNYEVYTMMRGYAGMSNGKPVFIWEFADSAFYYMDGIEAWDEQYLNTLVCIKAILNKDSVLTDWKIINCDEYANTYLKN